MYIREVKALERLRICTVLSEHLLFAGAISTKMLCTGPYISEENEFFFSKSFRKNRALKTAEFNLLLQKESMIF